MSVRQAYVKKLQNVPFIAERYVFKNGCIISDHLVQFAYTSHHERLTSHKNFSCESQEYRARSAAVYGPNSFLPFTENLDLKHRIVCFDIVFLVVLILVFALCASVALTLTMTSRSNEPIQTIAVSLVIVLKRQKIWKYSTCRKNTSQELWQPHWKHATFMKIYSGETKVFMAFFRKDKIQETINGAEVMPEQPQETSVPLQDCGGSIQNVRYFRKLTYYCSYIQLVAGGPHEAQSKVCAAQFWFSLQYRYKQPAY